MRPSGPPHKSRYRENGVNRVRTLCTEAQARWGMNCLNAAVRSGSSGACGQVRSQGRSRPISVVRPPEGAYFARHLDRLTERLEPREEPFFLFAFVA